MITYDDSDGWYDHVLAPVLTESQTSLDTLTGSGQCGNSPTLVPHNSASQPDQGRCGLGARLPFLLISPWAQANYVDHSLLDQSSVVKFITANWDFPAMGNGATDTAAGSIGLMFDFLGHPRRPLFLSPVNGKLRRRQAGSARIRPCTRCP